MKILIFGAGKAAVALLDHFTQDPEVRIEGITDVRDDAPGMLRARELGIPASTRMESILAGSHADVLINLTGRADVSARLQELRQPDQEIMDAQSARLMYSLVQGQATRQRSELSDRFNELVAGLSRTTQGLEVTLEKVALVMRQMKMLALNAGIEASRAGESGRGFVVIAGELRNMTADATGAVKTLQESTRDVSDLLGKLEATQRELVGRA